MRETVRQKMDTVRMVEHVLFMLAQEFPNVRAWEDGMAGRQITGILGPFGVRLDISLHANGDKTQRSASSDRFAKLAEASRSVYIVAYSVDEVRQALKVWYAEEVKRRPEVAR